MQCDIVPVLVVERPCPDPGLCVLELCDEP